MSTTPTLQQPTTARALLSLRSAVVLTLSILCGVGAGLLTFASRGELAGAALAGCGVTAAAAVFWNQVIEP